MLSAIFTMAANSCTVTKEETQTSTSEEEQQSIYFEQCSECRVIARECEPILAMLEDKNKIIENLRKQIDNQKTQLSFYFKKKISPAKIEKWSENCSLQASEESLPLNLAINKFCRQTGTKTKLTQLHERMTQLDSQMSDTLKDQEFLLRKVVNRLCQVVRRQSNPGNSLQSKEAFVEFVFDPVNIKLFENLLNATVHLRRKLDSFKICCDRVLIIEEERNEIVEQVYSIPAEKRLNCNYLLEIQLEKASLEAEIKKLSEDRKIGEIKSMEKYFSNLAWESNQRCLVKQKESSVNKILREIHLEAKSLLDLTKKQKVKLKNSIESFELPSIHHIVFYLKTVLNSDDLDPQVLEFQGIKSPEEIRLCQEIKCEINKIEDAMYQKFKERFESKDQEIRTYQVRLEDVYVENGKLKQANKTLRNSLQETKINQQNTFLILKAEKDSYKAQVEDLQAIREAYSQLVEKQPIACKKERDYCRDIDMRDKRIFDLEDQLDKAAIELRNMERIIDNQKTQILVLNRIIVNFSQYATSSSDKGNETSSSVENFSSCPSSRSKLKIQDSRKDIPSYLDNKVVLEQRTFPPKQVRHSMLLVPTKNLPTKKILKKITKSNDNLFDHSKNRRRRCLSPNRDDSNCFRAQSFKTPDGGSLTCFKIYSQKNGKTSDMVKAVVSTSGDVKGNLKIDNASTFSVEFKCKNSSNANFEKGDSDIDEFELFRDCSKESLANVYQNATKFKKSMEFKRFGIVDYRK